MPTVYNAGVFDILHIGHLVALQRSKELTRGGKLIVGVLTDEATMERKPEPIMVFSERLSIVGALRQVDEAIPQFEYRCYENILRIEPDILVINEDWSDEEMKRIEDCRDKIGAEIVIVPRYQGQSSTKIKEKIRDTHCNTGV